MSWITSGVLIYLAVNLAFVAGWWAGIQIAEEPMEPEAPARPGPDRVQHHVRTEGAQQFRLYETTTMDSGRLARK